MKVTEASYQQGHVGAEFCGNRMHTQEKRCGYQHPGQLLTHSRGLCHQYLGWTLFRCSLDSHFYELNFGGNMFFLRPEGFVSTYGLDATYRASGGGNQAICFQSLTLILKAITIIMPTSGKFIPEQLGQLDKLRTLSQHTKAKLDMQMQSYKCLTAGTHQKGWQRHWVHSGKTHSTRDTLARNVCILNQNAF